MFAEHFSQVAPFVSVFSGSPLDGDSFRLLVGVSEIASAFCLFSQYRVRWAASWIVIVMAGAEFVTVVTQGRPGLLPPPSCERGEGEVSPTDCMENHATHLVLMAMALYVFFAAQGLGRKTRSKKFD